MLLHIAPAQQRSTQPSAAGNNLIVRSTICCSVASGPNSSEAFLATSLRPTSKASRVQSFGHLGWLEMGRRV